MIDILLNENGGFKRDDSGAWVMGESTLQHQQLLLKYNKGDLKESPLVGVGAEGYLKDEDYDGLYAEIKSEYEKDGMKIKSLVLNDNNSIIDASYKETSNGI